MTNFSKKNVLFPVCTALGRQRFVSFTQLTLSNPGGGSPQMGRPSERTQQVSKGVPVLVLVLILVLVLVLVLFNI